MYKRQVCTARYVIRSNRDHTTLKMIRIDERGVNLDSDGDGEVTCDELVAQQDALVTWKDPDNSRCQ